VVRWRSARGRRRGRETKGKEGRSRGRDIKDDGVVHELSRAAVKARIWGEYGKGEGSGSKRGEPCDIRVLVVERRVKRHEVVGEAEAGEGEEARLEGRPEGEEEEDEDAE
jgi:hypothetical protein